MDTYKALGFYETFLFIQFLYLVKSHRGLIALILPVILFCRESGPGVELATCWLQVHQLAYKLKFKC